MPNSPQIPSIDLAKINLGELDSGKDANFLEYAIALPILDKVKKRSSCIIVGPKGSGKTGIRLKFAAEVPKHRVITLSEKEGFPFEKMQTLNPNEIKKRIQAYIISIVFRFVSNNNKFNASALEDFSDTPFFSALKKLAKSTKISAPFVTIALENLLPPDKGTSVADLLSSEFTDKLRDVIGEQTLWILIDDIDAFVSTVQGEQRRTVLEQLLYAVWDLNLDYLKHCVWIVAFLKTEVFKEVRKIATEFDKIRPYVDYIEWRAEHLKKIMRDRIEWNIRRQGLDIERHRWTDIFSETSEEKVDDFFSRLVSMTVNGPRNAIELMTLCIKNAIENNETKLCQRHIDAVAPQYGEDVIGDRTSFYQLVYPNVDDLIDIIFRQFKSEFRRAELERRIKLEFLNNAEVRDRVGQPWSIRSTAYKLIEIFYEVGVVGVFHPKANAFIYSFEDRNVHISPNDTLNVHPGLRAYLETSG